MTDLGRLQSIGPRLVWKQEAHDFTPWLLANSDVLAHALGIDLQLSAAEHPVGGFNLDLVGRDLGINRVLAADGPGRSTTAH
jgi:hypothetical protein